MRPQLHSPRMAQRRRQFALFLPMLAAAVLAVGCGGDDGTRDLTGEPFSESNVSDFSNQRDLVQGMVDDGDCEGAVQKVDTLSVAVDQISSDVDQSLKDDLKELLGKLSTQIEDQCQPEEETTTTTDESSTTSTEETTTTTTTTDTTDTDTTPAPSDQGDQGDTGDSGGAGGAGGSGGGSGTSPGQGGASPGGGTPVPGGGGDSGGVAPRSVR